MASWIIHLRVAESILNQLPIDIKATEFIVGNIAPDSGVPNEDWSRFYPDTNISHFKRKTVDGKKEVDLDHFVLNHLNKEKLNSYNRREISFFLGYYSHLMTDILWVRDIYDPCCEKHFDEYTTDKVAFTWKIKEDWYDLDFKFLRDNPSFSAFEIYRNAVGFENEFLDIFSYDAFDNRREYIVSFYDEKREGLDREYPFLTEERADMFVDEAAKLITDSIKNIFEVF